MKEEQFYTGKLVKLKENPNAVEITYKIEDLECFIKKDNIIVVYANLRPIKKYPHPDGGFYGVNMVRQENVLNLTGVDETK